MNPWENKSHSFYDDYSLNLLKCSFMILLDNHQIYRWIKLIMKCQEILNNVWPKVQSLRTFIVGQRKKIFKQLIKCNNSCRWMCCQLIISVLNHMFKPLFYSKTLTHSVSSHWLHMWFDNYFCTQKSDHNMCAVVYSIFSKLSTRVSFKETTQQKKLLLSHASSRLLFVNLSETFITIVRYLAE